MNAITLHSLEGIEKFDGLSFTARQVRHCKTISVLHINFMRAINAVPLTAKSNLNAQLGP